MDTSSLSYSYSQEAVSAAVIDQLARTKGWTRFMSVMLWIGAVLLIGVALLMMGIGILGGTAGEQFSQQLGGMVGAIALGAVYLAMAFFYIYPALKLGGYSSRIKSLMATPTEQNLVAALNEQRAFWKYMGVFMMVILSLYAIGIVILIITTVFAGVAASTR